MSTVAERLRMLRRDAGLDVPAALSERKAPPSPPIGTFSRQREKENSSETQSWNASPAGGRSCRQADEGGCSDKRTQLNALRKFIHRRAQPQRRTLKPPAGIEISTGLHYVETILKYEAAETLDIPAIDEHPVDRNRLLCFDTETTGLAGGVGTRAFMIGVAAWQDSELKIRQLYLTAIAGERAMLQTFADWLKPDTILVSYNGKSYDAPLLKGRMRLNRVNHCLADLPHIDWLHPTRRVYKGHLPNCKLATIEREVLRIVRDDDLPGSEAPAAWLAYLRGQSSRNLVRVLDHNRQDVITLMRLGDHLTTRCG